MTAIQPTVPNKYNLRVSDIKYLIVDRDKIQREPFWRNNVINAWCLSSNTAKNTMDEMSCDSYWLGIYDGDDLMHPNEIQVRFDSYGGMCHYYFDEFYDSDSIENDTDLRIQEMFLAQINQLIDDGVFVIPSDTKQ